jgi:hypothetical protein
VPSAKYIIFVGELGASDGSSGMYLYMLHNTIWKLEIRETISDVPDVFGGIIEKEVFIFKRVEPFALDRSTGPRY